MTHRDDRALLVCPTAPNSSGHHSSHLRGAATVLIALVATCCSLAVMTASASSAADVSTRATKAQTTRVTSWSTPRSAEAGSTSRSPVRVVSTGTDRGRAVTMQRRVSTSWSTVARGTTDARGQVTLRWTLPQSGPAVVRLVVARSGARPALTTSTRSITVVAASTPTPTPTPPTPTPTPAPDPTGFLARTLTLVNEARATPQTCGSDHYPAVPAVAADSQLQRAAQGWAERMGREDFFAHEHDGSSPGTRITAEGYTWRTYGENIAAGQRSPEEVVSAWMRSPGHCRNVMGAAFRDLGVGYAEQAGSRYGHYWALNFATRR